MVLQKSPESAVLWGYGPDAAIIFVSVTGPFTHKPPPSTISNGEQWDRHNVYTNTHNQEADIEAVAEQCHL